MKHLYTPLVIFMLISACQDKITVYLEKEPGAVTGIVHPINIQATVGLYQDTLIAETTSTSDGSFRLEDIPAGTYYLRISAEGYGTVVREGIAVKEGQTTFVGDLLLSRFPWPVRSVTPGNGASIDNVDLTIMIRFYEDIVDASFLDAFSIIPEVANLEIEISYYSAGDNVKISGDFVRGANYTISLDTLLATHFEQRLEFPLSSSFSIVPFRILTVNLPGSNTQSLEIIFNALVKHDSLLAHLSIVPETPVSFDSYYGRRYRSIETNRINLRPDLAWRAGTTTSITIDGNLAEERGATLGADTTLFFKMDSLTVEITKPYNGQHFVSPDAQIVITFNTYLDESTIAGAISISPSQALEFSTDQRYSYSSLTVYPDTLISTTTYTVMVDTAITDFWGGRMSAPYSFSFATQ
ncbi:MAG: Ig-like domain-containing protein [Fidelibacterota bacterium]|nr:MAG: Ig-like domain-containing protein [Candidatus Neomarinimicrobiota bacterium]